MRAREEQLGSAENGEAGRGEAGGFRGFPDGLGVLDTIAASDKEAFAARRDEWEATVFEPARSLVLAVGDVLRRDISAAIAAVPKVNGSLSPINRDLRFAADRSLPYKDHLLLNFWEGTPKRSAPTLRVRLAAREVGFAAGAAFGREQLERWRSAVAGPDGADLVRAIDELGGGRALNTSEPELARSPAGFEAPPDQAYLLRHKTFQVRFLEPTPGLSTDAAFTDWVAHRLLALAGVHRWLVRHTS